MSSDPRSVIRKVLITEKGTGRARSGQRRSPVWSGGGQTFGPKPRDYSYTVPRKARRKALRSVLSLRVQESKLIVLDQFPVANGKTKSVTAALSALGSVQPETKVLIVDTPENENLRRGARNLPSSKWLAPEGLNVYDVLDHDTLVITKDSIEKIQEALRS